jgi:tetratricopeptide (TPR) repeat protein
VRTDPRSLAIACAVLIGALLAAWSQWLPLRSEDAAQEALALIQRNPAHALAAAHLAIDRDPLSAQARFTLAKVQQQTGQAALAKGTLERAVRLQPSNPQTWVALGEYDLTSDPEAALGDLHAAIYLNPESIAPELIADGNPEAITIQNDYVEALRATGSFATAGTAIPPSGP